VSVNRLERYFRRNTKRQIHKWIHYFEIYDRHFARFRRKPIVVVEFGVFHGGSLQMWRDYFGRKARIYGIDINRRCAALAEENTTILIGDQADRDFLRSIVAETGPIDVVIEDGGHEMGQQIATFEEIYPHVKAGGVFLIEDVHTSYWEEYGGGYREPATFMEYAKGLTDRLNAWHSRDDALAVDEFTRTTKSVHFYDSIIVFEKGDVGEPHHEKTGVTTI
jgi:cephalosporin hydroxylase